MRFYMYLKSCYLLCLSVLCLNASSESIKNRIFLEEPITVAQDFIGVWQETKDCEKHPSWSTEFSIQNSGKDTKILSLNRAGINIPFNIGSEIVEKDFEKKTFRTFREVSSFANGRAIVISSTWKSLDKRESGATSVIMNSYQLSRDGQSLTFHKYGFTSGEEGGSLEIVPYSSKFPKNYRCIYKKRTP